MNIRYVFLLMFFIGCKDVKQSPVNNNFTAWNNFLKIVSTQNKESFKDISSSKIRCYLCLENTIEEQKELVTLRNKDSLWYEKLYSDLIFIPIDSFLKNDFDLLFNKKFVETLKNEKTTFSIIEREGVEYCEVLVTTTQPTPFFEGGQHGFQFKKVDTIWMLTAIYTIP